MKRIAVIMSLAVLAASCAHVISQDIRQTAVQGVPFGEVRDNIGKYRDMVFIWGGFIVKTEATDRKTVVEVVQNPLDSFGRVVDTDVSQGRFLAEYPGRLDPMIFKNERLVTVAGRLVGSRKQAIDGREYLYPVLEVIEIHLWKEGKPYYYPPYYRGYPYYSDPFYDPFYYDPLFYRGYPYGHYPWWWR